jgi:DNA-binding beta-propeller fold protein YncE
MRVDLPGGEHGIGLDDVRFAADLDRVLIPAGHTGRLDLLDPSGLGVTSIPGFGSAPAYPGGHKLGPTSADARDGLLVVIDRTARLLDVVDARAGSITASAPLGGGPDLVRVAPDREVWITEPDDARIEVFTVPAGGATAPVHAAFIAIEGGPESLTIDAARGRAYTHVTKGTTLAIDLRSRTIVARWANGCADLGGATLDDQRARLFVSCDEGRVTVLDLASGKVLSSTASGASLDHLAYSPRLQHLYVPDTRSSVMEIFAVSTAGQLSLLERVATAPGTECVTTDDRGHAYLCDPAHGKILVVTDRHAAGGG